VSENAAIIYPVVFLGLLGWLVPKLLSLVMPEGVKPLMLIGFLATLLMFVISGLVFLGLYALQGVPMGELFAPGVFSAMIFFGELGMSAAIVWAPILILSVAGLPRQWVHETW
jgi:hypothetical protein